MIVNISSSDMTRSCELLLPGWWTTILFMYLLFIFWNNALVEDIDNWTKFHSLVIIYQNRQTYFQRVIHKIFLIFPFKTHTTSFPFLSFQYSLKIQLHFLNDYYYLWLTAQICMYFTSVVVFVLIGYLGDDIISRMASVEIPFPSVVYVMFNCCHVIVYVHIEK